MNRIVFFLLYWFAFSLHAKPVEIVMWHSLAGYLGDEVQKIVADFNGEQKNYRIKLVYKGEYSEAITSFAAAFRAKRPPAIVQIFEVGTTMMLSPAGIIKPVEELMQEQGAKLEKGDFLPAVRSFYSLNDRLMAMPFNSSIPVIFYNADALKQLGYNSENFPQTWGEMEILARKAKQHGFACTYTTAYPAWIQIEAFSAIHGLPMIDPKRSVAVFNNEAVIKQLKRLKDWQRKGYFEYGGRNSDATILFTSGRCLLFSQSSGAYNGLAELVKFKVGMAQLPLDTSISAKRHNNVIGGAALWVVAGHRPEVYQGIAQFFSFLARPSIQKEWHQKTGYLPLGVSGNYAQIAPTTAHPALKLAQIDLAQSQANWTSPIGPQNLIRTINDEALEAIFAAMKSPQKAMDEAVSRANYSLLRFLRNIDS
nr:extracellular solute-binding protein [Legionella jordanis]